MTSTRRRTEYVKPVNLQRDNEKPIKLLVQPFTLLRDQKFVRTSSTEEVNISDVISPVSLMREGDVFRLSLADTTFLEAYFPLDTADEGFGEPLFIQFTNSINVHYRERFKETFRHFYTIGFFVKRVLQYFLWSLQFLFENVKFNYV